MHSYECIYSIYQYMNIYIYLWNDTMVNSKQIGYVKELLIHKKGKLKCVKK